MIETLHAKLRPSAARFHPFTNPDFFLRQQLVGSRLLQGFVMQTLRFALLIFAERTRVAGQLASIQLDDTCRQPIQKAPVMGNEQQRDVTRQQQAFQPVDRGNIQMVRWLIK